MENFGKFGRAGFKRTFCSFGWTGELYENNTMQSEFWVPTQHFFLKTTENLDRVICRKIYL